jgi:hypothetical protein
MIQVETLERPPNDVLLRQTVSMTSLTPSCASSSERVIRCMKRSSA